MTGIRSVGPIISRLCLWSHRLVHLLFTSMPIGLHNQGPYILCPHLRLVPINSYKLASLSCICMSYIILQLYRQYLWKQYFPWCCQCKPTPQMLSAVIHFALGCSLFTVGMIASTLELRPSQSSHTRERSSQCSNAHAGYGPNCLMTFWTQLTWFIVRGYMVLNRAKWWHAANPE